MSCLHVYLGQEPYYLAPFDPVTSAEPYDLASNLHFILQVHLCEVENPQDLVSLDFPINMRKGQPLLVAVKILRPDATKNAR
jgi:hypothetical protein